MLADGTGGCPGGQRGGTVEGLRDAVARLECLAHVVEVVVQETRW